MIFLLITPAYYSTDYSDSCYDHITFLDKRLNESYNGIYRIYQFEEIKKDIDNDYYYLYFITDHQNELISQIQQSNIAPYVDTELAYHGIELTSIDTSLLKRIFSCLYFNRDIVDHKRNIKKKKRGHDSKELWNGRSVYQLCDVSSTVFVNCL